MDTGSATSESIAQSLSVNPSANLGVTPASIDLANSTVFAVSMSVILASSVTVSACLQAKTTKEEKSSVSEILCEVISVRFR
jgi:hypothetical protein